MGRKKGASGHAARSRDPRALTASALVESGEACRALVAVDGEDDSDQLPAESKLESYLGPQLLIPKHFLSAEARTDGGDVAEMKRLVSLLHTADKGYLAEMSRKSLILEKYLGSDLAAGLEEKWLSLRGDVVELETKQRALVTDMNQVRDRQAQLQDELLRTEQEVLAQARFAKTQELENTLATFKAALHSLQETVGNLQLSFA